MNRGYILLKVFFLPMGESPVSNETIVMTSSLLKLKKKLNVFFHINNELEICGSLETFHKPPQRSDVIYGWPLIEKIYLRAT